MKMSGYISLIIAITQFISCGNNGAEIGGSGLIEATDVILSAQADGQLLKLYFDEGQHVTEGDTIGWIDTTTTALRLRQAKAAVRAAETKLRISSINIKQASLNLSLAEKEFDRIKALLPVGSANQQQYDKAETAYHQALLAKEQADGSYSAALAEKETASAQAAILNKRMDYSFPEAPLSGIIVTRYVDPGELVAIGRPLVKIANLDTVQVDIYLSPADLTRIVLGGGAKVDPENDTGELLDGIITWISDEAEFTPKNVQTKEARADLVYAVEITIPNPDGILKIGMPVSVVIE
jgi:HlyD family secretion protein